MECIETRFKLHKSQKIQKKIAQGWNVCSNYPNAPNGRIWILWETHSQIEIIHVTDQFIHCLVEDTSSKFTAYFSVVYAQNDSQ